MNSSSKQTISLAALALVVAGAAVVGFSTVSAHEYGSRGLVKHEKMHRAHVFFGRALKEENFELWQELTKGTPLEGVITSEADFAKLVEAHKLMQAGEIEDAQVIFESLGIERPFQGNHRHPFAHGVRFLLELTDEEMNRLEKARDLFQAGDEAAAQEMLKTLREA